MNLISPCNLKVHGLILFGKITAMLPYRYLNTEYIILEKYGSHKIDAGNGVIIFNQGSNQDLFLYNLNENNMIENSMKIKGVLEVTGLVEIINNSEYNCEFTLIFCK